MPHVKQQVLGFYSMCYAARYLGIDYQKFWHMVTQGYFPAPTHKCQKRMCYRIDDLEKMKGVKSNWRQI